MLGLYSRIIRLLPYVFILGWIVYPGYFDLLYFNGPEMYSFPASMVGPHDPHWGFWFW